MIEIAYLTKNLPTNGITNVIMNYALNIDKTKFKITVISGSPIEDIYRKKCEDNDISIIEVPDKVKNPWKYYRAIWKILNRRIDIIHIHGNSATVTIELLIALMKGIKIRIVHCHNTTCNNIKIHKLFSPVLKLIYTHGYACSRLAGKWMFNNKPFEVLVNGFDTKKFVFDEKKRKALREELNLTSKFVIGNVARFNNQKNHPYLLQIFEDVAKKRDDAVLLLVGNGPDLEAVKELINVHPFKDKIIYYGVTDHVEYLYDVMDIFVLPSKYEGLGIVFVEAQINGLPVITSDCVPNEVNICDNVIFLPITTDVSPWSNSILEAKIDNRSIVYNKYRHNIDKYDIKKNVKLLEEKYENLVKREGL